MTISKISNNTRKGASWTTSKKSMWLKINCDEAGERSVVRRTCCSCIRSGFGSQHLHDCSQLPIILVLGYPYLVSDICENCMHVAHLYAGKTNAYRNQNKYFSKKMMMVIVLQKHYISNMLILSLL